jgi:hypothetical protein
VRVGGNVRAPRKIKDVKPGCPAIPSPDTATIVNVFGRIGVDGFVNDVTRLPAGPGAVPPAELVESAFDAVRQWEFTPALLNGQEVEVSLTVQVAFSWR